MRPLILAALCLVACSGVETHPHTNAQRLQAAIAANAHAVEAMDVIAATRFRQEIATATDTERVFAEYQPWVRAREISRASLLIAEHTVDTYQAAVAPGDECSLYRDVHQAAVDATDAVRLASSSGLALSTADAAAPSQLDLLASALFPQCTGGH